MTSVTIILYTFYKNFSSRHVLFWGNFWVLQEVSRESTHLSNRLGGGGRWRVSAVMCL